MSISISLQPQSHTYRTRKANKFITEESTDDSEVKQKFFPPPAPLRAASSMLALPPMQNELKKSSMMSASTFYVNEVDMGRGERIDDIVKKRKKWYDMFRPPKVTAASAAMVEEVESPKVKKPKLWKKLMSKDKKEKKKKKLEPESSAC